MYDQGTLSLMTRGLPATRHVARTLDTWQLPRQVTTRGRRRRARRTSPARWTSPARSLGRVCREAHEALLEGAVQTPPPVDPLPLLTPRPSVRRVRLLPLSLSSLSLSLSPPSPSSPPTPGSTRGARPEGVSRPSRGGRRVLNSGASSPGPQLLVPLLRTPIGQKREAGARKASRGAGRHGPAARSGRGGPPARRHKR